MQWLRGKHAESADDVPKASTEGGGSSFLRRRNSLLGAPSGFGLQARDVIIPSCDIRLSAKSLGTGRLGSVCSGYWLEQPVAIKRIMPSLEEKHNPGTRKRLEQEIAMLMPHLSQPNILPLYGLCEQQDGSLWLVLKRGKKGSLKNVMKGNRGGLTLQEFFHIAKGIAAAMVYLHGQGVWCSLAACGRRRVRALFVYR